VNKGRLSWIYPPVVARPEDQAFARLLHWVTVIVALGTMLVTLATVTTVGLAGRYMIGCATAMTMVVGAQIALRSGRPREAAHTFVFMLWLLVTVQIFGTGGSHSPIISTYFPIIATTSVLMSRRSGIVYGLLSACVVTLLFVAESQGYQVNYLVVPALDLSIIAASLITTGGVIYLSSRLNEDASSRARASENQYAELVNSAPEGILAVDKDGWVRAANPAVLALTGLPTERLVNRPLRELAGLEVIIGTATGVVRPSTLVRPDGTRCEVDLEARPLLFEGAPGIRVSVRDVTAQRQAERDRARLTEQLALTQKQESIGLLAGGIAHDFNNLITVLLANVEGLRPTLRAEQDLEMLRDVEDASQRAAGLTRQLLAFSRRQVLNARNVSVNEVVEGLLAMIRRLVPATIELRRELKATGIVRADAGQLEQVLMNLVVNARDALPTGGVITLSTADVAASNAALPMVLLRVDDNGTGMPDAVARRIFEPFFTTKELGRGTGLGLSVVEGVVRQSGGSITVASVEGQGTRFDILLPRADALAPDRVAKPLTTRVEGKGRSVLLIEDEEAIRNVIARVLKSVGFEVLTTSNGEEALLEAAKAGCVIDVVVADVVMPKMGGPEALMRLRADRPTLKALFMSGYSDRSLEALGATGPHSAFIGKPFLPNDLLEALQSLLSRPTLESSGQS